MQSLKVIVMERAGSKKPGGKGRVRTLNLAIARPPGEVKRGAEHPFSS